jgi:hypothetical protein
MDNQTLQQLKDAITKSNSIAVAVRANPNLDQMAAALSLSMLLKEANKTAPVVSPSDPIVEVSNLVGINKVQKSLGGGGGASGDLVVSFPYIEGEIEKVSYTLENGFLNIIVKAAEQGLSFDEKDVQYTRGGGGGGNVDLLFVVGTQNLAELGNLYDAQKMANTKIINIDNSDKNQGFGDLVLVSPQASSVSELIGDIALSLGFKIERDAAQNLLSGLTTATQNFQNPRTSSLAFEVASYVMKRGAARVTRPQPQDDFAAQFLNRPAPQPKTQLQPQQQAMPQPQMQPQPQVMPQPQMQQQAQPRPQAMPEPRPQAQPAPAAQTMEDRQEQLRQQLRDQENQRNGGAQQQADQSDDEAPPVDWLTPKVYKGSSNF